MSAVPRILVVDDQREVLELTRTILLGGGYAVATAASGAEALQLVHEDAFDLVLLDINMPGMSGWETLRLLRADDEAPDLPVVMFSVKSEVRDRVHGLQEGVKDYITKPFGVDDLLNRVRRVLEASRGGGDRGAVVTPAR